MGIKKQIQRRESVHLTKKDVGQLNIEPTGEITIVAAAGSTGGAKSKPGAYRAGLEKALVDATLEAIAQGMTPEQMLEHKLAARAKYKQENRT